MKLSAIALALAVGCAGSAFAASETTVKDPSTGVTLHGPRVDDSYNATPKSQKFSAEVKSALHRVASATRRVVHRADVALHDAVHHNDSGRV
ncbi:hypothetical protein HHL11_24880 [Ramlibacter sp. G-1-2-2]|uniref:DUF4148 domain-containing protein n=1 Tax=Ramlibacter agri TaxID=2728837 RepID=A0A848HEP3_9BURK|nr:hypothetical protein [Ramlibacter agri]NML47003.1 hypothetical protein [Ramlibacter agri]